MAQRREKKAPPGKDRRPIKKKTSILNTENIDWIDYKDVNLLRRFMSERAKIRARRVTGNNQQQQVAVAKAIRVAREMALLPYSVRQVTQRSKGRRDRGDRGDRGELGATVEAELREIPRPIEVDDRAVETPRPTARPRSNEARSTDGDDRRARRESTAPGGDARRRASSRGRSRMKIVLRDDVDNLGKKGDLVDVADGYARNYLVPRGLALRGVAGHARSRPTRCGATVTRATGATARPRRRSPTQFGAARSRSRRGRATRAGCSVRSRRPTSPRRCRSRPGSRSTAASIALDEPLKELGVHEIVQVRLHPEVSATLHVEVEAARAREPAAARGPGRDPRASTCLSTRCGPQESAARCGQLRVAVEPARPVSQRVVHHPQGCGRRGPFLHSVSHTVVPLSPHRVNVRHSPAAGSPRGAESDDAQRCGPVRRAVA